MAVITETALRAMLRQGIPNPYPIQSGDKLTPAAIDFLKARGIQLIKTGQVVQQSSERPYGERPVQRESAEQISTEQIVNRQGPFIPVGVSNRHIHLTQDHVEQLFGKGSSLTHQKDLKQTGKFATEQLVTLVGPNGLIEGVRVLGPVRRVSQVEISRTDGFILGIHPPVRLSGELDGTPGITMIGTKGVVTLNKGLIIAKCHVHVPPQDAQQLGVTHGDSLVLQTTGERPVTFEEVLVRVGLRSVMEFHIDNDEANAAYLRQGDRVKVIGKNGQLCSGQVK